MRSRQIYEAKAGLASKNDIINSIGCTLRVLAETHRDEPTVQVYSYHIKVREVKIRKVSVADKETKGAPTQ